MKIAVHKNRHGTNIILTIPFLEEKAGIYYKINLLFQYNLIFYLLFIAIHTFFCSSANKLQYNTGMESLL